MSAPGTATEQLLGEVIAVLAGVCRDADRRGIQRRNDARTRTIRGAAVARLADNSARMRPEAARLAAAVAARDHAGIHEVLGMPRSRWEWRQLAIALAVMADPAKATGAPATAGEVTAA